MAITLLEPFNLNNNANFTFGNANVTGNLVAANATIGNGTGGSFTGANLISANYINVATQLNITGNTTLGNGAGGSLTGGNLISANYLTGTITTASQPNITSIGTLSSLAVTGNVSAGNVSTTGVVTATGNVTGNFFIGNGSQLTGISTSSNSIFNGNSNVNVAANGNVTVSVAGNSSILTVTGTGVNVAGTLNTTGNTTIANLTVGNGAGGSFTGANLISANYVNVATQLNISGNATLGSGNGGSLTGGNLISANYVNVLMTLTTGGGTGGNITGANVISANTINITNDAVIAGNLTVSGNLVYVNVDNLSVEDPIIQLQTGPNGAAPSSNSGKDVGVALNYYDTAAKIAWMGWDVSAAEIVFGSNVSIANEVVTFTTLANIKANSANVTGTLTTGGNIVTGGGTGGNISGANNISANTLTGTLTTASQPNITSIGTLSSLSVTGNISAGNVGATAGVFTGNISSLNANLGNLVTANYVNVATQLEVAGNITTTGASGNITGANVISANTFTGAFANGNSNISIPAANGNITFGVGGNANVLVVTSSGANLGTGSGGNISGANVISANTLTALVSANLGAIGNVTITGGSNGNVLTTYGNGVLYWGAGGSPTTISNGNSNVNIPSANGNVTISSAGNANIVVVTGTGVNVAGTLNATGNLTSLNADLGNLVTANYVNVATQLSVAGNITTSGASGNITGANVISANTFTGVFANGNSNVNIPAANGNITFGVGGTANVLVVTSSGANLGTGSGGNISGANVISANTISDVNGSLRKIPKSGTSKTSSYTLATTDVGLLIEVGTGGSITVPDATFATGDIVSIFNNTTGNVTLTMSITTAYIGGTDSDKATITLATRGVATILFISSTVCVVNGNVS